jgi:hypothetical protein
LHEEPVHVPNDFREDEGALLHQTEEVAIGKDGGDLPDRPERGRDEH